MAILLGCIADDFTGATDLANTLVKGGMRTVQLMGVPDKTEPAPSADAVVIALKSRTCPVDEAVGQSLAALDWLREHGARQIFFKYCSTFDSTENGNIGPVAEALMAALDTSFTIACPAFPATGRTLYQGYLFVNGRLLSESSMRDHPLTPMRDADLVRFLGRQTKRPVGLAAFEDVAAGAQGLRARFATLEAQGYGIAITDAVLDDHLRTIGAATAGMALVTGGSGVAMGLPDNFAADGLLPQKAGAAQLPAATGHAVVLSGSCSEATRGQVATAAANGWPLFTLDPLALTGGRALAEQAIEWASSLMESGPVIISASAPPDEVKRVQEKLGKERAGELIETAMGAIARGVGRAGARRLIVAGGETAGAVVGALGLTALRIGPQIEPGIPWTFSDTGPPLHLALKSGNFGSPDFFARALAMLEQE